MDRIDRLLLKVRLPDTPEKCTTCVVIDQFDYFDITAHFRKGKSHYSKKIELVELESIKKMKPHIINIIPASKYLRGSM